MVFSETDLAAGDLVERIVPELEGALFVLVFGSYGTPRFGPDSDLDLAADFGRPLPSGDLLDLSTRLSGRLERSVDLVDLRGADPIIAMQVLRTGRPILVRDPRALAGFQMTTPSRYFDWKRCRRPVEAAMWAAASS